VKGTREQSERDQHLLVVAAAVWPRRWPTWSMAYLPAAVLYF